MILILPQIKFEAIPSKDAGEVAFQPPSSIVFGATRSFLAI